MLFIEKIYPTLRISSTMGALIKFSLRSFIVNSTIDFLHLIKFFNVLVDFSTAAFH